MEKSTRDTSNTMRLPELNVAHRQNSSDWQETQDYLVLAVAGEILKSEEFQETYEVLFIYPFHCSSHKC